MGLTIHYTLKARGSDDLPVQWMLPRWAADLIRETIELDSKSGAFDRALRHELSEALGEIDASSQEIPELKREPMKSITVHRLSLQFDADQITRGSNQKQAKQAVDLINGVLRREPFGLGAQLFAMPDEIEVESAGEDET